MPILDMDPGQSPEAPGTLSFYEQGKAPSTGWQVTSAGVVTTAGGVAYVVAASGTDAITITRAGDAEPSLIINGDGRIEWGGGATAVDVALFRDGSTRLHTTNTLVTEGDLVIDVAGKGINVKEGANARMGLATLIGGTLVVATTAVTANSRIFLTSQEPGGTPGWVSVSARTPGTSFTILSSSGTDTSDVAWEIKEPAS